MSAKYNNKQFERNRNRKGPQNDSLSEHLTTPH